MMVQLSPFIICNNQGSARYLIFWHETPNRNPHSNEKRLTDRYNVHIYAPQAFNNVGDILHKKASDTIKKVSCMPPFLKQINLKKVQVINE